MRVPSECGIRGSWGRGCLLFLLALAALGVAPGAGAQDVQRYVRESGRINFVTTGGSLRNSATSTCNVSGTSTTALSGIPANTTIRAAYLYWGGSGSSADTSVTLNGNTVNATRTFSATYTGVSPNLPYFGAFAVVTNIVQATGTLGNGNYTFGNLTVEQGSPHCDVSAVVSGWSLIVIYQGANERVRAINLYDGLQTFRGGSITQTPDGFRVPSTNIDGRLAVFTLEGDPANSESMNNVDEALRFNGTLLDDGINVAGSDPTVQQFDGTINTQGIQTSYGIDVDQYTISSLLSAGQTSGTMTYSSGADLVLLMAQIVSATSDPVVDLTVTKSHTGNFISGSTGQYLITVSNSNAAGIEREDNTVTVTDTLPTGLTFASATGTGWSCSAAGQLVTCTHAAPLNVGSSFPPITLTVNVTGTASPNSVNSVTVSSPSFDLNSANNTVTDPTTVLLPDLSTSTKTVVDLNGGEAAPGDTLRYTITLHETGNRPAPNLSLADDIPANTTFGSVVSLPAGASSSFTAIPAGVNGRGRITVSNISLAAGATATVVFDVTVIAGTTPGALIENTATITNPNGPGATPAAPDIVVTPSLVAGSGAKFLYLRRDAANQRSLQRIRPTTADTTQAYTSGQTLNWPISHPLRDDLTISAGSIPVRLWLTRNTTSNASRSVQVRLVSSSGFATPWVTDTTTAISTSTPTLRSLMLTNAAAVTLPVGATLTLEVVNSSASGRTVTLHPNGNAGSTSGVPNNSRVELNSNTLVFVENVQTWNAAFNGGAQQASFTPGSTVFVRSLVSDPFGSFDIGTVTVTLTNPAGNSVVLNQSMTAQGAPATCSSTTAATCLFQYSYAIPNTPTSIGSWSILVTANEGVEGTISDTNTGSFAVALPQPSLTVLKTSAVLSDPTGSANPKRIPGAVVRYEITVTNSGPGTVDAGTLAITDPIPANSSLYVSTSSGEPVMFVDGTPPSGLSYNYPTNVSYSAIGENGPWTHVPSPDAQGFDAAVRAIRVVPGGSMNAAGSGNPGFTLQFRVRIH